jgi:hypothetical protein
MEVCNFLADSDRKLKFSWEQDKLILSSFKAFESLMSYNITTEEAPSLSSSFTTGHSICKFPA